MKTCFIVMPIGAQEYNGEKASAEELRKRYDDLIKEALLDVKPDMEIVRADDVAAPGAITSDIITRIMHSDLVVADVTFPNPNVYYELGLRHACKQNGTIIIKDANGPRTPFDISNLRHIAYTNTASGLKELAENLKAAIAHLERSPDSTDSSFQELAKLTNYEFPPYGQEEEEDPAVELMMSVLGNPDLTELVMNKPEGESVDSNALFAAMQKNPDSAGKLISALSKTGNLDLSPTKPKKKAAQRKKNKKSPPRTGG